MKTAELPPGQPCCRKLLRALQLQQFSYSVIEVIPSIAISNAGAEPYSDSWKYPSEMYSVFQMLMEQLGITEDDICSVYIAGAFGNYMDPVSAGKIGLLPATLVKKVMPVGNAAGEGAKIALVNEKEMLEMDELVRKIEFVELAASADFQDHFIDELGFETGE